jgi:hypothetical protein
LAEVSARVGDRVLISEWSTTKPLLVQPVGYSEETLERLGIRKASRPGWISNSTTLPLGREEHNREVNHYLSELFTQKS